MSPVIIGSIGVGLILLGFILNLLRKVTERSQIYLLMNAVGSLLAAWYALVGDNIPFLVLELVWAIAAIWRLVLVWIRGEDTENPQPATPAGG
ncbi:hypothetical protein GF377_05750 [candidate division GN15 bacterium]|nr:hypothetical protein [candidate division GN15 bacterium]